jgi:hypothetical protein
MRKGEAPTLSISRGKNAGQQVTIAKEEFTVGRDADCDFVLAEQQVSRQHIKIKLIGDAYYIEDLESRNGTWINGDQLKGERVLRDGDQIDLAQVVKLVFFESGSTAPISMIRGLRLDRESRRVFVNSQELVPPLSLPQYRLLELLVDANGAVCTREEVVKVVWPDAMSDGVSEQAIDALVRRLRDRLAELDPDHQYVVTVRGHGFRLDNPPD